ncbi:MAG TPA: hypothetical protein VHE37_08500 [Nevskiaceae bacterium]|nr:hypothetical protein [Nevskiaceae bacterium]
MKYLMVLSLLALAAAACTPAYQDQYDYQPPHGEVAQSCVAQCSVTRDLCVASFRSADGSGRQQCEVQSNQEMAHCQGRATNGAEAGLCTPRSCNEPTAAATPCDDEYRVCYASCGGTVTRRQVCTSNCPKP